MNKTYIALTIGPIYKTFLNVRKTKELWAASYMFSYLMKQIIYELKIPENRFIVPFINDKALKYKGVGIFPDRLIFKSENGEYQKLQNVIEKVVTKFGSYFPSTSKDIELYLTEYFRFCSIEKKLPEGANIINEMFKHLDTLELQNFPMSEVNANRNDLFDYFRTINKNKFFKENNFHDVDEDKVFKNLKLKDANNNVRFESVVEVATGEFKNSKEVIKRENNEEIIIGKVYRKLVNDYLWKDEEGDQDNDESFIEALKRNLPEKFKPYHKYMAIIKADGDKIGSTISGLNGNIDELRKFSQGLLNWAFASDKVVRNYGGIPIYIGGDDLLLFAPITCKGKTIIDLIDDIDISFTSAMSDFSKTSLSLSYGISITYYKFPMFEAISKVDDLLKQAKNYSVDRNAICIRILKHSGSVFETTFRKGNVNTKEKIQNVLECISSLSDKNGKQEKSFLNSVGYCIRDNEKLINLIEKDKPRVENFFANNFDDYKREKDLREIDGKKEKRKPKAEYLKKVEELLVHSFEHAQNTEEVLPSVYSILRISRFLKGQEDEK